MTNTPLLRAPPFSGLGEALSSAQRPPLVQALNGAERGELFAKLRERRVGGSFWGKNPGVTQPIETVIRINASDDQSALLRNTSDKQPLWVASGNGVPGGNVIEHDIDPWPILLQARHLIAHGKDEWVALARIVGISVQVLTPGSYGSPSDTHDDLDAKTAEALAHPFFDPFSQSWVTADKAIELLTEWRRVIDANRGGEAEAIVAACGFSWWKREEIRKFLWLPEQPLRMFNSSKRALTYAAANKGALAVWPSRVSPRLLDQARSKGVPIVRVEDGFIRSRGLGSNLVPPCSVVVDRQGIHFDPRKPSDLETLLAQSEFPPHLLARTKRLREAIIAGRISKYATSAASSLNCAKLANKQRIVLVPGQVEDDMSVLAGSGDFTSNLELLRRARAAEPDAQIWWRPHPDVDAGHRAGFVSDEAAGEFADRIVRDESIADLLEIVDALHVLTSLSGFEALLRGLEVICHGTPFYAGWGLTRDLGPVPSRRGRALSIDALVAGVLLLYPRYLDPVTGLPCPAEVLVSRMAENQMPNRLSWMEPVRRLQGRLLAPFRKTFKPLGAAQEGARS